MKKENKRSNNSAINVKNYTNNFLCIYIAIPRFRSHHFHLHRITNSSSHMNISVLPKV